MLPQANRQVERANDLILARLKPRLYEELKDYGSKWIDELPKVAWTLCTQVSRAIGYSPFFLVYCSEAITYRFDLELAKDRAVQ